MGRRGKTASPIVNAGRRPIIMRLSGGEDSQGEWGGTYLDHEGGGVRLGEHEALERYIEKNDPLEFNPEGPDICHWRTRAALESLRRQSRRRTSRAF